MKHKFIYLILIIVSMSLLSCSDEPVNTLTITNNAEYGVQLNFKGTLTEVPSGETVKLTDMNMKLFLKFLRELVTMYLSRVQVHWF